MHNVNIRQHIIDRVMSRRGKLHLFDRLEPRTTALVIIDMQNTFLLPGSPAEVPKGREIVKNINYLSLRLRKLGGHIVWITHGNHNHNELSDWPNFFNYFVSKDIRAQTIKSLSPGGDGQKLWHDLDVYPEDSTLFKNRYSALTPGSSPLERRLRSFGIETVLIAGTKTNVCCESTARDSMMLDFKTIIVSDCCAALSDEEHRSTLETFIQQFGDVMTSQELCDILNIKI